MNSGMERCAQIELLLRSQVDEAIRVQEQRLHEYENILRQVSHEHSCPADADRLQEAFEQELAARNATWRAMQRLSDFQDFGWIPEDLQPKIAQASA